MEERRQSLQAALNASQVVSDAASASSSTRRKIKGATGNRTVSAALLMCLHLGIDPPDSLRPPEASRLLAWQDANQLQLTLSAQQAAEQIARACAAQYEWWQSKLRIKWLVDPTGEDVRRLLQGLRKSSRDERVLVHYCGHGVPRPTQAGELWFFNRQFTQYIPLPLVDLLDWVGSPCCLVLDCTGADVLISQVQQRPGVFCLGAAAWPETLPTCAAMPADLLTACLTTPIEVALRWHGYAQHAPSVEALLNIPGKLSDRRTPLGHLNWLFTAITDTIAWLSLSRSQFKLLFRQDALLASLWRNALLAQRILRFFHCTLQSYPALPLCNQHVMWQHWDLALDQEWQQGKEGRPLFCSPSTFWWDQLEAFDQAISRAYRRGNARWRGGAEHLPCVLQALLSPVLRPHALTSLGRFMLLNRSTAIEDVMAVGLYPYLSKLLGSEEKGLVIIWMALITAEAADTSTLAADLRKDGGWKYFVKMLGEEDVMLKAAALAVLAWYERNVEPINFDTEVHGSSWIEAFDSLLTKQVSTVNFLSKPHQVRAAWHLIGMHPDPHDDPSPLVQDGQFMSLLLLFHQELRDQYGICSQQHLEDVEVQIPPGDFVVAAKWEVDGLITAGWLEGDSLWLGDDRGRIR